MFFPPSATLTCENVRRSFRASRYDPAGVDAGRPFPGKSANMPRLRPPARLYERSSFSPDDAILRETRISIEMEWRSRGGRERGEESGARDVAKHNSDINSRRYSGIEITGDTLQRDEIPLTLTRDRGAHRVQHRFVYSSISIVITVEKLMPCFAKRKERKSV